MVYDPYHGRNSEEREAIGAALFDLRLALEDWRGWFTWMWIIGICVLGWAVYKSFFEPGWLSAYTHHAVINYVGGVVMFIAGVALRINAAIEMRHLKRLETLAARQV